MRKIIFTEYFKKKYKKLIKNNTKLGNKIDLSLSNLITDPLFPGLKSHKVNSRHFDNVFSSSVTGDIRIIWKYGESEEAKNEKMEIQILELLDIGGHGGKTGVY